MFVSLYRNSFNLLPRLILQSPHKLPILPIQHLMCRVPLSSWLRAPDLALFDEAAFTA